jgi:hypothetical protein
VWVIGNSESGIFTDLRYEVEADGDDRVVQDRNRNRICFLGGKNVTDVRFGVIMPVVRVR